MLQYLLMGDDELDGLLAPSHYAPGRRRVRLLTHTVVDGACADGETPVFALLRAQMGLPLQDARWWRTPGRHVAVVLGDVPGPVVVPDPTIDLLERTLAALRAWEPSARDLPVALSRR